MVKDIELLDREIHRDLRFLSRVMLWTSISVFILVAVTWVTLMVLICKVNSCKALGNYCKIQDDLIQIAKLTKGSLEASDSHPLSPFHTKEEVSVRDV
jgi:hypothetical protein